MSIKNDWVEVSEFPEYEIHPDSGIRRKGKESSLKGRNWLGYPKVTLMKDGKKHERRIHKLVGEHFIPNPKGLPIVNHMDSDRSNHTVRNLEWVDNSGNQLHRWKTQKEGLQKMKYEKEYDLKKAASMFSSRRHALKAIKSGKVKPHEYEKVYGSADKNTIIKRLNSDIAENEPNILDKIKNKLIRASND